VEKARPAPVPGCVSAAVSRGRWSVGRAVRVAEMSHLFSSRIHSITSNLQWYTRHPRPSTCTKNCCSFMYCMPLLCPRPHSGGSIINCPRLSVCPSVCGLPRHNWRTERPRKPKFGGIASHTASIWRTLIGPGQVTLTFDLLTSK